MSRGGYGLGVWALERPEGANGRPGEISMCTCTDTCTDISPLACTSEISKRFGAGGSHRRSERRGGAPSGYPGSPLSRQVHADARPRQHVDRGVDAEAMEAPPHVIVHARLAYPQ